MWKRFDKDDIVSVFCGKNGELYMTKGDIENYNGGVANQYIRRDFPVYISRLYVDSDIEKIKAYLAKNYGLKHENIIDKRNWRWYDENSQIVVAFCSRIVGHLDQRVVYLFFTLKDNVTENKEDLKNMYKMEELPNLHCFEEARNYLVQHYGFKAENIEALDGDENRIYKELGYYGQ